MDTTERWLSTEDAGSMRCAASHVLMSETRSIVGELVDYFGFAIKDETFGVQMDQVSRGYFGDAIPELQEPK